MVMTMFVAVIMPMTMIVPVIVRMTVRVAVVIVLVMYMLDSRRDRYLGRRLRVELFAEQQHHRGPAEREQRYQPDMIEKVHITTSIGRFGPLLRFPCSGTAR